MLVADSNARVLSVSRKDRAAILPIGRARSAVFWYAAGKFTTSRYYADSLPSWVTAYKNGGSDIAFPHRLTAQPDSVAARLAAFPWMDSLTLDFALTGVRALGLGHRDRPDLLSVSLS